MGPEHFELILRKKTKKPKKKNQETYQPSFSYYCLIVPIKEIG